MGVIHNTHVLYWEATWLSGKNMEEMEEQSVSFFAVSSQSQTIRNVRLKIVDDNLYVLNEFTSSLNVKVNSDVVNVRCVLEFIETGTNRFVLFFYVVCPESGKLVFTVRVFDSSHVYQCGTNVVLFRVSQGSAAITLSSQNGEVFRL